MFDKHGQSFIIIFIIQKASSVTGHLKSWGRFMKTSGNGRKYGGPEGAKTNTKAATQMHKSQHNT